jgi:hypothetical protein
MMRVRHTLSMDTDRLAISQVLRLAATLVVGAWLTACGADLTPPAASAPPSPGPVIRVSATRLSWTRDSVVRYVIANPDGVPIYRRCPFHDLQYYRDGWQATSWQRATGCVEVEPPYWVLARGDSVIESHRLTNDLIPRSGWYRFTFLMYRSSSDDNLWPEANRVSPAFYVGP